jgi:hypothetical protein
MEEAPQDRENVRARCWTFLLKLLNNFTSSEQKAYLPELKAMAQKGKGGGDKWREKRAMKG